MDKTTKDKLIELLQDLYTLRTKVNQEEINVKQMMAFALLKELKLSYTDGYALLRKYSHSNKEFNIIMRYA